MLILLILSVSLLITAILGGGILPFSIAVLAALFSSLCFVFPASNRYSKALPIFACALILFLFATCIPLPSSLAANFGSKRAHQNLLAEKALQKAQGLSIADDSSPFFSITRNRAGTARIILLLIAGFSVAALSSRMPLNRKEQYLRFLVLFGATIAIAGIISQWIIPQGKNIWWLFPVPHGRPVGCFINRNHFGGFVALLCAPAVFMIARSIENRRYYTAILNGLCFLALSLAAVMSLSKGAWLALSSSVAFSLMALLFRKQWVPAVGLIVSILIIMITVILIPSQQLNQRINSLAGIMKNQSLEMRVSTWRDSLAILRDYPVTGTGANAFRMVFPQYRAASTRKPFEHAENEYVQTPVEFGIPASAIIAAMLICVFSRWKSTLLKQRNLDISLCVAGALLAAGTHAVTDYSLRIPLYFLTVCSLVGLVISSTESEPEPNIDIKRTGAIIPAGALIIVALLSFQGSRIYQLDSIDYLETAGNKDICRALVWSPTSWQAWYNLGKKAVSLKTDEACSFGESCLTQATRYDPMNYLVWHELSLLRFSLKDLDGSREAYLRLKELRPWKKINELEMQKPPL